MNHFDPLHKLRSSSKMKQQKALTLLLPLS